MIVYLDTSALVPLLIAEPSSAACRRLWDEADDIVSSRLSYVEAAAALAQARRLDRLTPRQQSSAIRSLDDLWSQMQIAKIDQPLVKRAADLADKFGMRGYDAVHAASAEIVNGETVVAGAGDRQLLEAWQGLGINTYDTNAGRSQSVHNSQSVDRIVSNQSASSPQTAVDDQGEGSQNRSALQPSVYGPGAF